MVLLKSKYIAIIYVFLTIVAALLNNVYGNELPAFADVTATYKTAESSIVQEKALATIAPVFNFQSESQILMELSTGEILYTNCENEKLLPASVTKVMTLLLTMEAIDDGRLNYTDKITCTSNAAGMGGSQVWFKEGEQLTVDEALKCICIVSANDVSVAMAEHIAGSEENFVNMMNEKAKTLGMVNTHFMNAHGIDEENHYTTAKDIAIMSRELVLRHPDILKYTSIWTDTIRNGSFNLSNTNKLLTSYEGALGLKTGSTSQALYNLSALAKRDGMMLIAVVMKAPTSKIRQEEVSQLLNYGFSNYQIKQLVSKGDIKGKVGVNKNITEAVNAIVKENISILNKKGANVEYTENIILDENIKVPIKKGDSLGKVEFLDKEGKCIKEVELVSDKDVNKSSFWEYITRFMREYGMTNI